MRKFICAFLLMILVFSATNVCFAVESRASSLISGRGVSRYASGNGRVEFVADVSSIRPIDKLGMSEISVEEYYGGTWRTVKTVTNKYGYDTAVYSYLVSYDGVAGRQYRAYVEYYAKDGSVTDTKTTTSASVTAK